MAELDGLDELISASQEGMSEILLRFQPDTDMSRALSDVRGALDNVTDLPEEAEQPPGPGSQIRLAGHHGFAGRRYRRGDASADGP